MKRIKLFFLALALLGLVACGGSNAADKARANDKPENGQTTAELPGGGEGAGAAKSASAQAPADFLRLSAVHISPADLFANVDLNAEAVVVPPVPEAIDFEYRWFVTNREVADATGPILPSGNFRKHQWVFCEARATTGKKVSDWLKSDFVRIANSPPQVESVGVENFTVPGQFRYQIKASDIDNDELTYELISPLDAGIELDKKSGLLTWQIDEKTIERLGETIVISLSVGDNDGQPTTGSLTLRFQKNITTRTP
ncbi:MAG: hypothetical protein NTW95_01670 [Candidatus Aminicenantes bacterium]|nr:hypothetical protein [Candidatus Aminicenantes bacterium]